MKTKSLYTQPRRALFCLFVFCAGLFFLPAFGDDDVGQVLTTPPIRIKVLLNKFNLKAEPLFSLHAPNGVLLKLGKLSPDNETFVIKLAEKNGKQEKLKVFVRDNVFYLQNPQGKFKRIQTNEIHIKPMVATDCLSLDTNEYQGFLSFKIDPKNKTLLLINSLDLEDYVYSVLPVEGSPTWPLEMHKVQAIVTRSYAVHQIMQRKSYNADQPYDIKCTNIHQMYNGAHNYKRLRKAVDETRHQVLVYKKDVVLAMFDACCGGSTPALMKGIDFSKAPYLARKTPCHYCKDYYLYSWSKNFSVPEFLEYLYYSPAIAPKLTKKHTLVDVAVLKTDKAGIVQKVAIDQGNHRITVSGKDFWSCMNDHVRSKQFSVTKKNNRVIVKGHGYGHQIGLCQHGAKALIDQGWDVKKVLSFYYPNTKLAHLTYDEKGF